MSCAEAVMLREFLGSSDGMLMRTQGHQQERSLEYVLPLQGVSDENVRPRNSVSWAAFILNRWKPATFRETSRSVKVKHVGNIVVMQGKGTMVVPDKDPGVH